MKPFGNKLLLKWREPNFAIKHVKKHLSWSDRLRPFLSIFLKSILFMFAFFTVVRLIHGNTLQPFSFEAIAISIGVSVVICFLALLLSTSFVEIQIRENSIDRFATVGSIRIPYKEIQSCCIRVADLDGQKFEVLEIKLHNGQVEGFEIAPSVSGNAVIERLRELGVQITPRKWLPS